jgi:hypothetical protein
MAPAARGRDSDELHLGTLAYTLRAGTLVARAIGGLVGDVESLGRQIVGAARSDSQVGCAAISLVACPTAGLGPECLTAACEASLPALDLLFAGPILGLDSPGIDFMIEGNAVLMDLDRDLVGEQLVGGRWRGTARLADGTELRLLGVFQAIAR